MKGLFVIAKCLDRSPKEIICRLLNGARLRWRKKDGGGQNAAGEITSTALVGGGRGQRELYLCSVGELAVLISGTPEVGNAWRWRRLNGGTGGLPVLPSRGNHKAWVAGRRYAKVTGTVAVPYRGAWAVDTSTLAHGCATPGRQQTPELR